MLIALDGPLFHVTSENLQILYAVCTTYFATCLKLERSANDALEQSF